MANLVFRDSFDTYNGTSSLATGLASRWTGSPGSTTLTTGRFGTGQAVTGVSSGTSMTGSVWSSALGSFTFEGSIRFNSTAANTFLEFLESATVHVQIGVAANSSLTVLRNGTLLNTSAINAFTIGVWYTIQVEVVISDTVGRVSVYLDNTKVLEVTGADTQNAGTGLVDRLRLSSVSAVIPTLDDIYVQDTATRLTDPLRAEVLYPNADGSTLNLTPSTGTSHFGVVDETLASATDYLTSNNIGDFDLLGLTDLSVTPVAIQEVVVIGYAGKTDIGGRAVALGVKSGATTSDGPNNNLSTVGGGFARPLATDPNTSAAWTKSGVDALQLQPKVVA